MIIFEEKLEEVDNKVEKIEEKVLRYEHQHERIT